MPILWKTRIVVVVQTVRGGHHCYQEEFYPYLFSQYSRSCNLIGLNTHKVELIVCNLKMSKIEMRFFTEMCWLDCKQNGWFHCWKPCRSVCRFTFAWLIHLWLFCTDAAHLFDWRRSRPPPSCPCAADGSLSPGCAIWWTAPAAAQPPQVRRRIDCRRAKALLIEKVIQRDWSGGGETNK